MIKIEIFRELGTVDDLVKLLPHIEGIDFRKEIKEKTRGMDPIVLAAIITAGGAIIVSLIQGIFQVLQNMQEDEVVIFLENQFPIKISKKTTEEELDEFIKILKRETITKIVFR